MAEHLRRDAGAVGDEEHGAALRHGDNNTQALNVPMRVAWLKDLRLGDLPQVGGKNASLGEMIGELAAAGIRVPGGFATTADAFREFLAARQARASASRSAWQSLDRNDVEALAACGKEIRSWIVEGAVPGGA